MPNRARLQNGWPLGDDAGVEYAGKSVGLSAESHGSEPLSVHLMLRSHHLAFAFWRLAEEQDRLPGLLLYFAKRGQRRSHPVKRSVAQW